MFWGLIVWLTFLAIFYAVSAFLEKNAAMRGSNRKALPSWTDKSLRIFFLITFMMPLGLLAPYSVSIATLLYAPFYLDGAEKTGTRKSALVINSSIWKLFKWYFSLSVAAPYGPLNKNRKYILGVHPHGFIPFGTMVNLLTPVGNIDSALKGTDIHPLAASFCFYIPGYRDLLLAGGVVDAARYNARQVLDAGKSIAVVVGGATEGLYAFPGRHTIVLKKRTGFIKLALETGADLVPVYSFGESECYNQLSTKIPVVRKFQMKFQRVLGLSLPLVTNIIPRSSVITTVFGKPIAVRAIPNPTDAQVQDLLDVYEKALTELFYAQAPTYIPKKEERKLEII